MSYLPDDVREALLKTAKSWVLNNYIGDRKKLEQWNDHYAYLTDIHSYSLPGNRATNLRRLRKLVEAGLLIECKRGFSNVCGFTAPRPVLDQIGQQAVREWEAAGYRVGEMMNAIAEVPA